ncbi:Transcription factor tau subunit sfc6 [Trametes pubescens]|uniref:Transcription factor tau subunit sfc6 n=1 Tax=Trametes pubescens TaxID=154538 RepID=A0A1M2VMT2_TRAPU|nr:Transcription factor tau subunit sfc6 [Trametes pubescens]
MQVDDGSVTEHGDAGEMRCEMVLCIESGPAFELKWCPLPSNDLVKDTTEEHTPRKLGILGGTFEDGSLTFYAVPDPSTIQGVAERPPNQPLLVKLSNPLLRIEFPDTSCWCFDWANSEIVAVGCTNGSIAVYNVGKAFYGEPFAADKPLLPTHYFTAHQSAIRSVSWIRAPVISASGEATEDDPTVIASGGYDGVECITDIRDMHGNVINRTRDVVTAMEFSTYTGSAVTIDHENMIKAYSVSPSTLGRGHTVLEPNGPIWSLSASDYHPQLAIGPFLEHKIYQLDYSRSVGEYRMLENFLPQETQNRPAASRQNKSVPVGTGAWPPEVGIHRVAWNDGNGLARTPLLASATGSGLCRVDWLMGRWMRDQLPYTGIEGMRGEMGGVFEDDDESD